MAGKARVKAQRLECREQRWVGDSAQAVAGTGHGRYQGTGEGLAWTGAIWALILILPQPSCMTLGKSLGLRFLPQTGATPYGTQGCCGAFIALGKVGL